jgi:hypothetical protein
MEPPPARTPLPQQAARAAVTQQARGREKQVRASSFQAQLLPSAARPAETQSPPQEVAAWQPEPQALSQAPAAPAWEVRVPQSEPRVLSQAPAGLAWEILVRKVLVPEVAGPPPEPLPLVPQRPVLQQATPYLKQVRVARPSPCRKPCRISPPATASHRTGGRTPAVRFRPLRPQA